jgi:dihydroorotase
MPRADLLIRNGTLVSGAGRRRADVAIADGRFIAVGEGRLPQHAAADEIDATGLFVLPGLIDGHVHFREPGLEHKEDWLTGSRAAVMGGITTVLDMPNTVPPTDRVSQARLKAGLAAASSYCDFGLFGLVGSDNADEILPLARSGLVVGFKVFLGETTGSLGAPSAGALEQAMTSLAGLGFRIGAHAEDRAIVEGEQARLRAAGRTDPRAHLESRSAAAEAEAIREFGRFARNTGCPAHVFHLSSADGLAAVARERAAGADMTCEVSAHHCLFSADDATSPAGLAKTNPPIREPGHGAALLAALADGRIDMVASDHAPHSPEDKSGPGIWDVAPGIAGVETTLPLFLARAVGPGLLTLEQLVRAMAEAPARIWGLWPRKGSVQVGADADLTLVDPERRGVIRGADLHGKHGITPFEGWPTHGAAVATIVRGRVVMRDGRLVGEPGWGRLVTFPQPGRSAAQPG